MTQTTLERLAKINAEKNKKAKTEQKKREKKAALGLSYDLNNFINTPTGCKDSKLVYAVAVKVADLLKNTLLPAFEKAVKSSDNLMIDTLCNDALILLGTLSNCGIPPRYTRRNWGHEAAVKWYNECRELFDRINEMAA